MFVEELQRVNFLNYERFSCIDEAYTDFLNKLITKVVNETAPCKEIRIKNNTQEWFEKLQKSYKKLSIKFQILMGKRKESSMKLS